MGDTSCLTAVVLAVALLVLPAAVADEARPVATVSLSGPHEVLVEGGEQTDFQLHVSSRLECASGLPAPSDLVVMPASDSERSGGDRLWQVEPPSVRVLWTEAPGEPDVYVIDALLTFNVTSETVPSAPVETETELLVKEFKDQRTGLRCQVEGYDLDVEEYGLAFVVVPPEQDTGSASSEMGGDPPVRWVPMTLAIAILASLAAFATMRERQRRGA